MKNNCIKKLYPLAFLVANGVAFAVQGESIEPWVDKNFPFNQAEDSAIEQAKGWAKCSATIDLVAQLYLEDGKEATGKSLHEYAVGASTAAMAPFFIELADEVDGMSPERLKRGIDHAKTYALMASDEWVESAKNNILARKELATNDEAWLEALATSFKYCVKKESLEVQQIFIDAVRALGR